MMDSARGTHPVMRVEALNVGWFTTPAAVMLRDAPLDEPLRLPVPAYLIETAEHRILVDTGLHPAAIADPQAYYGSSPALSVFTLEQQIGLAEQTDLSTLTMVILTHLHFDHAGGLDLIPQSVPLVIQRAEWSAAHDAAAIQRNAFLARDYAGTERPLVLADGDHDLLGDGSIELLLTPGHTPGHQSVRIGELVIGGDVAHFAGGLEDRRFPMFAHDHREQGRSADRLRDLRDGGATVLPGHDPDVLCPGRLVG